MQKIVKFKDTREQLLAQCLDRHLAITANAGSGKTYVLVKRYLNILMEGMSDLNFFYDDDKPNKVEQIVAITFTKKAASEMRAKVIKAIEKELKQDHHKNKLRQLHRIRESLTYSRISTIHSFCASLLRQFPIEADISPNFIESTNIELYRLKNNSISDSLQRWMDGSNQEQKLLIQNLIIDLSYKTFKSILEKLIDNPFNLKYLYQYYQQDNEEILKNRIVKLNEYHKSFICYNLKKLIPLLKEIDFNSLKNIDDYHLTMEHFEILSDDNKSFDNFVEYSDYIKSLKIQLDFFFTQKNTLRSREFKNKISEKVKAEIELIAGNFISKLITEEALINEEFDNDLINLSRILVNLAIEIEKNYQEEKHNNSLIDFEDLMLKVNELLKNENPREKIKSNIKYLLVDEFQDTNDIQYEIIKSLVPELTSIQDKSNKINLFIVGDAKQSIYGFRNADVRVFQNAIKDIRNLNQKNIDKGNTTHHINTPMGLLDPDNEYELLGDITLKVTFRLQPVIAGFVNFICGHLMNLKSSDFDVNYTPFVCSKNIEALLETDSNETLKSDFGSVTFLLNENGNNVEFIEDDSENNSYEESEASINEALMLASHIEKILSSDSQYFVFENGEKRKPFYRDIAILARKKNRLDKLATEFISKKIPFIIHSGNGYFKSQEILDIISYLNFLNNSKDDLSLIAILRSPFFGLTDTELFLISKEYDCESFWAKLLKYFTNIPEKNEFDFYTKEKISRSYNILNKSLTVAAKLSISELIIFILDITNWYGSIVNNPASEQIKDNIDKFLDFARDYESRGFRNIFDFVEELNFILEKELDDSEPANISGDNAVNVLTVHSAKGLEFPIVYLYDTNYQLRNHEEIQISKEFGLTFPVPSLKEERYSLKINNSPLLFFSKRNSDLALYAEEKRLLYVALTRAKDHLIITSTYKKNKEGGISKKGFFNLLMQPIPNADEFIANNEYHTITTNLDVIQDDENITRSKVIKFDIIKDTNSQNRIIENETNSLVSYQPIDLSETLAPESITEYYSPTKLTLYAENIEEYIKKYILGLPAEEDLIYVLQNGNEEQVKDIAPKSAGTMIHKVLEKINLWLDDQGNIISTLFENIINQTIVNSGIEVNNAFIERIKNECQQVALTKLIKSNVKNIKNGCPEFQLQMPLNSHFINGLIDLLLEDGNGNYVIWDWKTNRIENEETKELLIKHYELQMKVYAFMLMHLYKEQEIFEARLLFTRFANADAENKKWTHKYLWNRSDLIEFGDQLNTTIKDLVQKFYGV